MVSFASSPLPDVQRSRRPSARKTEQLPDAPGDDQATARDQARRLALVVRAQAGHLDAQSKLVHDYAARVAAFVRPIISQPNAVEDVVQTIFIKMVRCLGALRNPVTFESWLFSMARNAALDFVRHRRCRPATIPEEGIVSEIPDYHDGLAVREITEALELALTHLSPRDRRIVTMIVQGASYRVVAEREGLSVGAVKLRLNRVRPFLRRSVGEAVGLRAKHRLSVRPPPRCRAAA